MCLSNTAKITAMAQMKHNPKSISSQISAALSFFDWAQREFDRQQIELTRYNDLTQDLLHELELGNLNYDGRARLATRLAKCRRERRAAKDVTLALEPLIELLTSDKGKQFIRQLSEALGKTRGAERRLENRVYNKRCAEPCTTEKQKSNTG